MAQRLPQEVLNLIIKAASKLDEVKRQPHERYNASLMANFRLVSRKCAETAALMFSKLDCAVPTREEAEPILDDPDWIDIKLQSLKRYRNLASYVATDDRLRRFVRHVIVRGLPRYEFGWISGNERLEFTAEQIDLHRRRLHDAVRQFGGTVGALSKFPNLTTLELPAKTHSFCDTDVSFDSMEFFIELLSSLQIPGLKTLKLGDLYHIQQLNRRLENIQEKKLARIDSLLSRREVNLGRTMSKLSTLALCDCKSVYDYEHSYDVELAGIALSLSAVLDSLELIHVDLPAHPEFNGFLKNLKIKNLTIQSSYMPSLMLKSILESSSETFEALVIRENPNHIMCAAMRLSQGRWKEIFETAKNCSSLIEVDFERLGYRRYTLEGPRKYYEGTGDIFTETWHTRLLESDVKALIELYQAVDKNRNSKGLASLYAAEVDFLSAGLSTEN